LNDSYGKEMSVLKETTIERRSKEGECLERDSYGKEVSKLNHEIVHF